VHIRPLIIFAMLAAPASTAIAQAKPSLEQRVQRLEDESQIRRILVDYAAFLDGRDYARYAALFAADGEWTGGGGSYTGQAAIRGMLENVLGKPGAENRSNFHLISNPQVDIAPDGQTARTASRYLFVMRGPDGRPLPSLAGIYRDELVRGTTGWVIKRRVADDIMPTPDEWRKIIAAQQAPAK
jgi:hypothetical protein